MGEHPLADVQRFMATVLQRPEPLGADLQSEIGALVVPSPRGMTPIERLEVYRDQFWIRHLKNLTDDYPTLAWAIGGPGPFEDLARGFIVASPPKTWDLQRLGAAMPAYVARHGRWSSDRAACDAANLDWAFMEVFDAPNGQPFDPSVLATMPEDAWPAARLELHPALRLVALQSDLTGVREALKSTSVGAEVASPAHARPLPSATWVAVWRDPGCHLRSLALEPAAYALLVRLNHGEALGEACEAVASEHPDASVADSVGGWFQQWVQRGWLSRVIVPTAPTP